MATRQLGTRVSVDLYELAEDIAGLTKESLAAFVSAALRREIDHRLKDEGDSLKEALNAIKQYRGQKGSSDRVRAA